MNKTLVFGHKNPDTDTISSAITYAYYLNQTGIEAEAVALGEPNSETQFALETFGFSPLEVIETAADKATQVALVDHNEPQQSVDDISSVKVTHLVDHHRIAGFETADPISIRVEPVGCTATILYQMFQESSIEIPKEIAGLMLSAIISDSLLFNSPTCTEKDVQTAHALAEIAEVDVNEYGLALLKAGANLSAYTSQQLLDNDAKNFDMNGHHVRIGQVNVIGFEEVLSKKDELLSLMEEDIETEGYDLFILVMTDVLESNSKAFVAGKDATIVEPTFDTLIEESQVELPGLVSRKKQMVPQLTKAYDQK